MLIVLFAFALAVGFGAGRVHHPANLKLSVVKAEIMKVEGVVGFDVQAFIARMKALL